ncbi:MAG: flagellar M-ring protein FliF [Lachnospiraceae bacterium]|nr:flagellar M-ring protein FliF [Lachnospiraceae bacterium]
MQKLKEYWAKISDKTKKLLIVIIAGTIIIAAGAILVLKLLSQTGYATLFTGLNQEEAQEVASLLYDTGVTYQYVDATGTIRVPEKQVDQLRATLLMQGYPKSGFAYDMYIDNAGLMTTESDKRQYTLYELQDRLGAQIRLFDQVQDAKVTISPANSSNYALAEQNERSASVTVTMKAGETLQTEQAAAIKNLIAHCVNGMTFTDVSVFDAGTGLEVSGGENTGASADGTSMAELTAMVEENIAANIRRILEKLYGQGNVAVSVKGNLNMEQIISESTQYTVPEKIDDDDKTGLLESESGAGEYSGAEADGAGDVVGADANADEPRYTYNTGGDGITGSSSNSYARQWLYNVLKEQRQVSPGVLQDVTVAVVINTDDLDIANQELVNLISNAAGIDRTEANQKVSVVRALSSEQKAAAANPVDPANPVVQRTIPLPLLIAVIAQAVLILLLLLLMLLRRRKKKKAEELEENMELGDGYIPLAEDSVGESDAFASDLDEEMENNEAVLNLRMQHSLKLKQNIGDFVDQNPQIAAKLIQGWLRGEGGDENGGSRKRK